MTNAAQNLAPEMHPLRAAVEVAEADYRLAQEALETIQEDLSGEDNNEALAAAEEKLDAADTVLDAAREALVDSDCPREWELREDGHEYATETASSAAVALAMARENVDRGNYNDTEGTIWIDVNVSCKETGESESDTVQLDEDEPDCESDGGVHNWQSPIELVGGIKENPGCWGHGGGVIITEVCMHCGCKKTTDTWAQRPDTGEQGLTSVSYETGAFTAEEIAEASD